MGSDRASGEGGASLTRRDERTEQIIKAGHELLGVTGLEGLTVRAVLARTGLVRRAFYERFNGKDDLMLAIFEYTVQSAADYYRREVQRIADPLDRLRFVIESLALGNASGSGTMTDGLNRRGPALSREHLRLADARPSALRTALSPLFEVIANILEDGINCGAVRPCSTKRVAPLIYNLVATTVHTEFLSDGDEAADFASRKQTAEDLWDFCLAGVAI